MIHSGKILHSYVNGQYVPQEGALISVQDRGFRFGDGVFDTIAVHDYAPYQWAQHLARITEGLEALRIEYDTSDLADICKKLLHQNHLQNGFLRITISRGCGSRGYLPVITTSATVVIETLPAIHAFSDMVSLWKSSYMKPSKKAFPVQYKTMQGLNSTLARLEAHDNHCFDALLLNEHDVVCESSSANIFWYKNNALFTPSLECGVLAGTTREAIIRLSPVEVNEGRFTLQDLMSADSVFLTNVSWQILPVKQFMPNHVVWSTDIDTYSELFTLMKEDIATYNTTYRKEWATA